MNGESMEIWFMLALLMHDMRGGGGRLGQFFGHSVDFDLGRWGMEK